MSENPEQQLQFSMQAFKDQMAALNGFIDSEGLDRDDPSLCVDYSHWPQLYKATREMLEIMDKMDKSGQTESPEWDEVSDLLLHAIACDADMKTILCALTSDQAISLAERSLSHPASWQARLQLAFVLERHRSHAKCEQLLLALAGDANQNVSRQAIMGLAEIGSANVSALALDHYQKFDKSSKIACLQALFKAKAPELPRLIALARNDADPEVVAMAERVEKFAKQLDG
ncbi:MAG: HEAT repeat domain-containing protein [Candidatus Obscuribacterales bacterium]|nr:HEAT repeat domain-containing protein [Candidatus Obscuribacterales bacterium]